MYLAKSRTSETQTQVDKIPNYYALNQNFPNPFNPETKISYSIAENSNVTLKVYNILGSEIATLVNKKQNSGNYEVSFNAVNISSGIYFYTLQSGNYTQTKKMVLVK
ncbi:MAG: T9SS type A sorting domain-containing protein [Ignavibacteriales bacterium]|nr:T9SS type A sorting domain-containing protein [Ignavibacteriales bacterium]MBK7979783.1 T9SS type A sorting domain-containing protein [Ignavibacteriota bacterium]